MLQDDFAPNPQDLQQAAQQTLERRKQMQDAQSSQNKEVAAQGAGIVGALIGSFLGNPMAGYTIGKQAGNLATGKGGGMPGMDQLQALFKAKKPEAEGAAAPMAAGLLGPATMRLGTSATDLSDLSSLGGG